MHMAINIWDMNCLFRNGKQESGKVNKKKGKAEKVKPILVNKDEPVVLVTEPSPSQPLPSQELNHFDVIQPKDDLELIRSHSVSDLKFLHELIFWLLLTLALSVHHID